MEENSIKVYVKLDSNNVITDINSDIFLTDTTGYAQIDKGTGDKYAHAQGNYLDKGLIDNNGKYNYKLFNNVVRELTDSEKESLFQSPIPRPTEMDLLKQQLLETQNIIIEMKYQELLNKATN